MLLDMAKKRRNPGRPRNETDRVAFQVRIPRELHNQLIVLKNRTRRLKGEEVQIALERYLESENLWPISDAKETD